MSAADRAKTMTGTTRGMTETPVAGIAAQRDPFDVIPQVLDLVRLNGSLFFRWDFGSPWSYRSPTASELITVLPQGTGSLVMFHIVAEGHCWVALEDGVRHELVPGDVVVMPYGDVNIWGSFEPAETVNIATLMPPQPWPELPYLHYGGAGEETRMVCGYLRGDAVLFDPVLRALPSIFVVAPAGRAGPHLAQRDARVRDGRHGAPGRWDASTIVGLWSRCSPRCFGCTWKTAATRS